MLERSLVRTFHANGLAEGVGFLIDARQVLTCAHIVATALGLKTYPETPPSGEMVLDFPLLAPGLKLSARVLSWQIPVNGQGDVAVLEITSPLPENAIPARLIQAADLWHHTFRAFGFPKNHENGTWVTGRILGTKAGGWQQIESTEQTGYFVQPGFSGGPVWDERLGGVVGMIMEAETATRAAFMSPVGVLATAYPLFIEKIEQIITPASDVPAPGEPPFKGLPYFDVQDTSLFFGREALTQELAQRLSQKGSNFLAIVGSSGSGKSSLARAGLIPALMEKNPGWIYRIITPTARPLKELAVTLTADVESVTAATTLIDDLSTDPRSLDIAASRLLKRLGVAHSHAPHLLLIVDQFEELFTACKDLAERKAFIDNLLNAVGLDQILEGGDTSLETSKVSIVLTLRADFYHHCAQYDNLRAALETHQAYIGPMTTEELRRAIEAPASENGWDFEPELVNVMLRDVDDEPGALPLLSHALLETWQRRKGRILTLTGYHSAGGVRGAIAQTADRVYSALSVDSQKIARDIFLRLTELGEGTQDTRRRAALDELIPGPEVRAEVETVLKTLADARLVTTEKDSAEVTHEALIRVWPTLQEWLDKNRESLRLHRHLTEAAKAWQGMGREAEELYRGARLIQVLEWVEAEKPTLNELERNFLKTSQIEVQKKEAERDATRQQALEQAQKLEKEQQKRAQAQRQRSIFLTIGLIIAVFLSILSFSLFQSSNRNLEEANLANTQSIANAGTAENRRIQAENAQITAEAAQVEANTQAQIARLGELSAIALSQYGVQDDVALLVSVEAFLTENSFQTRQVLYKAWKNNPSLAHIYQSHQTRLFGLAISPDGKILATGTENGIMLWDFETGKIISYLASASDSSSFIMNLAFSPDGNTLASVGVLEEEILLWNIETRKLMGRIKIVNTFSLGSIVFSPDGHYLALASEKSVQIWNLQKELSVNQPIIIHADSVYSVAFSPDSSFLASGSTNNNVQLWNIETGLPLGKPLTGHTDGITSVAFSPDGNILASASGDHTIRLWDVATGQTVGELFELNAKPIWRIAFSPSEFILASWSGNGTITLWNILQKKPVSEPLRAQNGYSPIGSLVFSPDGQKLATLSAGNNSVLLWNINGDSFLNKTLAEFTNGITSLAFGPDGKILASASKDKIIRLWNVETGQLLGKLLTGHTNVITCLSFSPDGQLLASGSRDSDIWISNLSDVDTRKMGYSVETPFSSTIFGEINSIAFSSNEQKLIASTNLGHIFSWDIIDSSSKFLSNGTPLINSRMITSAAFSSNGELIAYGLEDDSIYIWDISSGLTVVELSMGHTFSVLYSGVTNVAVSPDANIIASTNEDGLIYLWDIKAGHLFGDPITGQASNITSLAFNNNGQVLASSSDDGTIRLWDIAPEKWIATICERVGRNLTKAEWNQYLYWKPFDPAYKTCPQWPSAAELSLIPTPSP